jgi:hypothetical protein
MDQQIVRRVGVILVLSILVIATVVLFSVYRRPTYEPETVRFVVRETQERLGRDELGLLYKPHSLAIYKDEIFIVDRGNHRIVVLQKDGVGARVLGKRGKGPAEFTNPTNIRVKNGKIFVADEGNQRIQILTLEGEYLHSFNARLFSFMNIAVNSNNHIFLNGYQTDDLVLEFDESGRRVNAFGSHVAFDDPRMQKAKNAILLEVDEHDNVYSIFYELPLIRKYNSGGKLVWEEDISWIPEIRDRKREIDDLNKQEGMAKYNLYSLVLQVQYDAGLLHLLPSTRLENQPILSFGVGDGVLYRKGILETKGNIVFSFQLDEEGTLYFVDNIANVVGKAFSSRSPTP